MTTVPAATDRLGLHTCYYRIDGTGTGTSIRGLLESAPESDTRLDKEGVREHLTRRVSGQRTCFRAVRPIPAGCELTDGRRVRCSAHLSANGCSAEVALEFAVGRILDDPRPKALALSGGLDSALILALLHQAGGTKIPVYTLASAMPGYCEIQWTRETAQAMGVRDLRVVNATEHDFVTALPATIAAAEVPLYNLHPVSKLLLARAAKEDGIEMIITGDGADQVFGTTDGRDYLPIVGALFRAANVDLTTPFADEQVIAAAENAGRDRKKSVLREIARTRVPHTILNRPKRATFAPAMEMSQYARPERTARIADELGMHAPIHATDWDRTLWATLGLLVQLMRGEP